ncbi:hypothetical protein ACX93W_21955 [Paenibacillus sp. CAU 1782]
MANTISLPKKLEHLAESIGMSNGLTAVFIEVLAISGSILAKTNREKELVIWLAQRDQSAVGIGTVGFELDEMPWTEECFESEKKFMLSIASEAIHELGWKKLSYEPRKDWVISCLEKFRLMIQVFEKEYVNMDSYLEWTEIEEDDVNSTIPRGYPTCEKHAVYLSLFGCVLCNNGS